MSDIIKKFSSLDDISTHLREQLTRKQYVLLFAYNGTGKTRLSMSFKEHGKQEGGRDTLYFNAFTEDLFSWDNDLDGDSCRELRLNTKSAFFKGLFELEMDSRVRQFLSRYTDFDFKILEKEFDGEDIVYVSFERQVLIEGRVETVADIKISRGEENIFVWCFFLAIVQLAFDTEGPDEPYSWVKYILIDDPVSSLDENNLVFLACDLVNMLLDNEHGKKIAISTHHSLFFNVLSNELKGKLGRGWEKDLTQYHLSYDNGSLVYSLREEKSDTPYLYHLSLIEEMTKAVQVKQIKTYHFNMLRSILEKTSAFFGYKNFTDCIEDDEKSQVYSRFLNLFSHGKDSFFSHAEPGDEQKRIFEEMLDVYLVKYHDFERARDSK